MTHIIEPAELDRRRKATRRRGERKDMESRGKGDKSKLQQQQRSFSKGSKFASLASRGNITNGNAKRMTTAFSSAGGAVMKYNTTFSTKQAMKNKQIKRLISSTAEIYANTSSLEGEVNAPDANSFSNPTPTAVPVNIAPIFITLDDIKDAVVDISRHYSGLVVVANTGAWYNSREKFRKELPVNQTESNTNIVDLNIVCP